MKDTPISRQIGILEASTFATATDRRMTVTFFFFTNENPMDAFKRFYDRLNEVCKEESVSQPLPQFESEQK